METDTGTANPALNLRGPCNRGMNGSSLASNAVRLNECFCLSVEACKMRSILAKIRVVSTDPNWRSNRTTCQELGHL